MIKNITLILILCFVLVSCGKKSNPSYENLEKNAKMKSILMNKA